METSRRNAAAGSGSCFQKALDLLSRRPHFHRELARKLRMRGFDSEQIQSALDRAADRGFLNDLECAREFARVRAERRNEGPTRLLSGLARRGADADAARQAVAECFPDGEGEVLLRAATHWLDRNAWHRDRLARHLYRKGFSQGAILSTLEHLGHEHPAPDDQSEELS